jgi:hypothetical protein
MPIGCLHCQSLSALAYFYVYCSSWHGGGTALSNTKSLGAEGIGV